MKLREQNIFKPNLLLKDDEEQHRWLISYADLVTLLLCFFIALYAISNVNLAKYKQVAQSIGLAFNQLKPQNTPEPAQNTEAPVVEAEAITEVNPNIADDLAELLEADLIGINEHEDWIEISLKSNVLFSSGDAQLLAQSKAVLEPIALILKQFNQPIRVEGFTDNIPIQNPLYPSNWELSSARSSAVARFLIEQGLPAQQLFVVGYAENFPIRDNATHQGREANRRVNIVLSQDIFVERLAQNQYPTPTPNPQPTPINNDKNTDYKQQLKVLWTQNKDAIEQLKKMHIDSTIRYSNHPERVQ